MDSNQILHNTKHHQVLIVGGSNMHPTNPKWRMAAILERKVISPYLRNRLTDFDEVWHDDAYSPPPLQRTDG